jgi:heme/copper-type cytochrome/quinol oxidase subunit 2
VKKFQMAIGVIVGLVIGVVAIPAYIWFQFASSDTCQNYGSCLSHGSEIRSLLRYSPIVIIALIIWRGWAASRKLNAMQDDDLQD